MRHLIQSGLVLMLGILPWMGCGGDGDSGVCGSACAQDAECYPPPERIPNCVQFCSDLLGQAAEVSADCEGRFTDMLACVADLSCDRLDAYYSEDPPDSYPCKAEEDIFLSTCGLDVGAFEVQP
jgi:hypothetical protein